jgi:DNA-binding response OmpR family regulator
MTARRTVLIADDAPEIVDFIAEVLTDEGYQVRRAINGPETLATILANPPDLALIDLVFGGMSGLDVVRDMRTQGIDVPVVIMTANTRFAYDLEQHGAVVCLRKPFDLDELLACVSQHIQRDAA